MLTPWHSLEMIGGSPGFPAVWQSYSGDQYAALKTLCLRVSAYEPHSYPCPRDCGCWHRIIRNHDHTAAVATCRCKPCTCPDFPLTIEDITPLQLNTAKLASALCQALLLNPRSADFPLTMTWQIASFFPTAVPIFLTIQGDPYDLRIVVSELGLRLQRPYILLAPTSDLLNAKTQELLAHAKAAFFPLTTIVTLTDQGTLRAVTPANELFAAFSPSATPHSPLHIPYSLRTTEHAPHPNSALRTPHFALRKGLGVWHLIFDGKETDSGVGILHERGIFYVAWLLYHPPENPIHALDLAAKIPEIYRQQLGLPALVDPATGKVAPLQSGARIQERSLALDDKEAMRAVFKQIKQREAILDDEHESEPVKAEALRELEQLYEFQRQYGRRSIDSAQRAARTVRQAIVRFQQRLLAALDKDGNPHPVLRPFAEHIEKHILIPSARHSGARGTRVRGPAAGSFTYEPPPGVSWQD